MTAHQNEESVVAQYKYADFSFKRPLGTTAVVGHSTNTLGRKFITLGYCIDEIDVANFAKEVANLRMVCNHPHILPLESVFVRGQFIYELYPLSDFGSANRLLAEFYQCGLPEKAISTIANHALSALDFLHERGIIHRSIRASHLLVDSRAGVRLAGMRHAIRCCGMMKVGYEMDDDLEDSLLWLAPEILAQDLHGYNHSSDIYSLGITMCELANGFPPFSDMERLEMLLEKLRGTTPRLLDSGTMPVNDNSVHFNRTFTPAFHNFVEQCLRAASDMRPTAPFLRAHPFVKKTKKSIAELLPLAMPITDNSADDDISMTATNSEVQPEWIF